MTAARSHEHEDARRIREALRDPLKLCDDLGMIPAAGRGRVWFVDGINRVRVLCPWHVEKTGSCSVSLGADGTIRVRCFGCQATGDALSLVAVAHGLDVQRDFARVLDAAADVAGVERPARGASGAPRAAAPSSPARPRAEVLVDDGTMTAVAEVLAELAPVDRAPGALAYLRERCIARGVCLGWYAMPATGAGLDALRDAIVAKIGAERWALSGLANTLPGPHRGRFASKWRGRLVIPWHGPNGAVETLQGRLLEAGREGEGKYNLPAGREPRWPWGVAELVERGDGDTRVAFVEGAVDAVSFNALCESIGHNCIAVGLPGASAWRDEWAELARGRVAVVALDGDAGGARAAPRIKSALVRVATEVHDRSPVEGKDWNDTWRARTSPKT